MRGKESSSPHGSATEPYTLSLGEVFHIDSSCTTRVTQGVSGKKQPSEAVGKAQRKNW